MKVTHRTSGSYVSSYHANIASVEAAASLKVKVTPAGLNALQRRQATVLAASNDSNMRPKHNKGMSFENSKRRKGRAAHLRSPDDSPLRDGNRDRLVGFLTDRAAKTLLCYLMELNPAVYQWLVAYVKATPIPKDGNWDDVSGETFLRNLLSMPIQPASVDNGRDPLFQQNRNAGVDPRSLAQRIMEIRSQLAKEFVEDLNAIRDENAILLRETLVSSFAAEAPKRELKLQESSNVSQSRTSIQMANKAEDVKPPAPPVEAKNEQMAQPEIAQPDIAVQIEAVDVSSQPTEASVPSLSLDLGPETKTDETASDKVIDSSAVTPKSAVQIEAVDVSSQPTEASVPSLSLDLGPETKTDETASDEVIGSSAVSPKTVSQSKDVEIAPETNKDIDSSAEPPKLAPQLKEEENASETDKVIELSAESPKTVSEPKDEENASGKDKVIDSSAEPPNIISQSKDEENSSGKGVEASVPDTKEKVGNNSASETRNSIVPAGSLSLRVLTASEMMSMVPIGGSIHPDFLEVLSKHPEMMKRLEKRDNESQS